MTNLYHVSIEPIGGGMFGLKRDVYILTDTIQNAMAIGKTKCMSNEEVTGVYVHSQDVVVDHQAVGTQQV